MTTDPAASESGSGLEWLLTPEEFRSLCSSRRLFLACLSVAIGFALGAGALAVSAAGRQPRSLAALVATGLGCVALAALAAWCAGRARMVGQDIRNGRADMQWGRVTRIFHRLRVAEVEGRLFPVQMTPIPALRAGERVQLRFAPRSRITFGIRTLREVVAAERLAGRPMSPGVLAELREEPEWPPSAGLLKEGRRRDHHADLRISVPEVSEGILGDDDDPGAEGKETHLPHVRLHRP